MVVTLTLTRLTALVAVILLGAQLAAAQPAGKVPRIGVLTPGQASMRPLYVEEFRRGLRELGYIEGQTVILEFRWDEGKPERFPELAADLARLKVDVIIAGTAAAIPAAKQATTTIPIVMTTAVDPVERGLVASLARPGGNVTGMIIISAGLSGKRLQLLKEAVPGVSRVGALWNPRHRPGIELLKETEVAARALGMQIQPLEADDAEHLDSAFRAATQGRAQAVIMIQNPLFFLFRAQIAELGLKHRLPTMSGEPGFAQAGGLMNYGPDPVANWHHAATYVDKILRGAKPADLPVERPTKIELVLNLRTAKALGLTIPQSLLLQADHVIE